MHVHEKKKKALQEYSKKLIQHLMWTWKEENWEGCKGFSCGGGENHPKLNIYGNVIRESCLYVD